ncbi:MAG: hypothetical protein SH856_13165 [Flavobacteriales bacterium]|nr:hypothetical protein [Flavobacteriales bacterium]
MKKSLVLPFILLSSLQGFTQKDSSFFELGLNTTRLITMFNLADGAQVSPYLINAEYNLGKFGLRLGAGHSSLNSNEEPGPVNGQTEFLSDSVNSDMRIGIVLHNRLSPKWSFKFGVDAIFSTARITNQTATKDGLGETHTTFSEFLRKESGASPFAWLQYHFSNRVSIATELQVFITSIQFNDEERNSQFPEFDTERIVATNRFSIEPPTALFLIVRF